jgi:hypothetical protein
MSTQNLANLAKYSCELCEYITNNKYNYDIHLSTRKHIIAINATKQLQEATNVIETPLPQTVKCFECNQCGQKYTHKSSMYRHKRTCTITKDPNPQEALPDVSMQQEIIMHLLKENQEFQKLIIEQITKNQTEQTDKLIECMKECKSINNTTNNITNNNTFNMQIFLNEQCANALNIMDFINQLQLQLSDLEEVGKIGYVQGISKIFIRGLKELDVHKRPIHCSDLKREVMYIKDNNEWEKEDEKNPKIKKAIQLIANKNLKQINEWKNKNPDFRDGKSKNNEKFMTIMNKACGCATDEENDKYYDKIVRNVAKEVAIVK